MKVFLRELKEIEEFCKGAASFPSSTRCHCLSCRSVFARLLRS